MSIIRTSSKASPLGVVDVVIVCNFEITLLSFEYFLRPLILHMIWTLIEFMTVYIAKVQTFIFVWWLVFEIVFLWFCSFVLLLLYQGEKSWLLIYVGGSGKHFTILKENYAYQMISNFCEPIHLAPKFMFQPSPTICSFQTSKIQLWLIRVSNSYLSDNFLRHYFLARWAHVHTSWSW